MEKPRREVSNMINWLASYPRSGSTLLRVILNCVFGVKTASFYSNPLEERLPAAVGHCILSDKVDFLSSSNVSYFVKTHELPNHEDKSPAVYVVRDGRDTLVSYAHFALLYDAQTIQSGMTFEQVLQMLIESKWHFGGWSKHVQEWLNREAPTALVRFEDMVVDPVSVVAKAFNDINFPLSQPLGMVPEFGELQHSMPEFFRKGQPGTWRAEMSFWLEELFWSIHGETMNSIGYSRIVNLSEI
jgi:hypothetical protein